jgi:hypothetical protein
MFYKCRLISVKGHDFWGKRDENYQASRSQQSSQPKTSASLKPRLIGEFASAVTARLHKTASSASRRLLRSRSARCLPQSTIHSPALPALTGSPTHCLRWPSGPRSKETGTTLRAASEYGCRRCGSSASPSSRHSSFQERQQVGVNCFRLSRGYSVGKALVGFQCAVSQQLCR